MTLGETFYRRLRNFRFRCDDSREMRECECSFGLCNAQKVPNVPPPSPRAVACLRMETVPSPVGLSGINVPSPPPSPPPSLPLPLPPPGRHMFLRDGTFPSRHFRTLEHAPTRQKSSLAVICLAAWRRKLKPKQIRFSAGS